MNLKLLKRGRPLCLVLLGVLFVNILYATGVIDLFSKVAASVMSYSLGLPDRSRAP